MNNIIEFKVTIKKCVDGMGNGSFEDDGEFCSSRRQWQLNGCSRAAWRLRAIVSKHIQDLENHLSARLLNRSTRHLSLTEIGHSYYSFCVRILAQIEEEHTDVVGLQMRLEEHLRSWRQS